MPSCLLGFLGLLVLFGRRFGLFGGLCSGGRGSAGAALGRVGHGPFAAWPQTAARQTAPTPVRVLAQILAENQTTQVLQHPIRRVVHNELITVVAEDGQLFCLDADGMRFCLLLVFEPVGVDIAAAAERSAGDAQPDGVRGVADRTAKVLRHVLEAGEGWRRGPDSQLLQMLTFHNFFRRSAIRGIIKNFK